MTFSQSKKKLSTHSQKVKAQKERELDQDFDGDAKCLIAQSPYLQWQLSEGQWDKDSAIHYAWELTSQFQTNRKQQEQLSE